MNKSFKTLFTLFLGILYFIPTFTANSAESWQEIRGKYPSHHAYQSENKIRKSLQNKKINDLVELRKLDAQTSDYKLNWEKKYPSGGLYKAWAEGGNNAWQWNSDYTTEASVRRALKGCERRAKKRCVVIKIGDKHLTYQEQAEWSKKVYGVTTLAAKIIEQNSSSTQQVAKKKEKKKVAKKKKEKKKSWVKDLFKKKKKKNKVAKKEEKKKFGDSETKINLLYAEGKINKATCVRLKEKSVLDAKNTSCNNIKVVKKEFIKTTPVTEETKEKSFCNTMRTEKNKKLCLKVFKPKKVKKATFEEIKALGKLEEFNSYPEGMLKEFKNCKKLFCQSKKAGKKVYEIFVKRGSLWHQRHPGDMIYGMAWYEIMYLGKFKKTQVHIDRYLKLGPDKYPKKYPYWFRENDIAAIHSLIKMNKGRIKMREALGFSAEDDLATVLHQYFLLGDFIANDKVKVKKVKMSPELKKRKELLSQYRSALNRYKSKLEEEEG